MTAVISIGECMVELRQVEGNLLRRGFAGDAFNTAAYLKRAAPELDVSFMTVTGDERLSQEMIEVFRRSGLNDRWVFRAAGKRPALYLVETDSTGERQFHYWRSETPAKLWWQYLKSAGLGLLERADLLYLSGISLAILSEADRSAALSVLTSLKVPIAFDPNVRPALWGSVDAMTAAFETIARACAILLPSRSDLEALYGIADPSMQLRHLRELTNAEVALTCDAQGCRIWSNEQEIRLTHGPVTVVDTSGAGDAFNGAYLGARLRGHSPETAGMEGLKLASQVVQLAGAAPEL